MRAFSDQIFFFVRDLTLALAQEITEKQELGRAVQPGFMFQRRFRPSPAKVSIRLRLRKKAWFQSSVGILGAKSMKPFTDNTI